MSSSEDLRAHIDTVLGGVADGRLSSEYTKDVEPAGVGCSYLCVSFMLSDVP